MARSGLVGHGAAWCGLARCGLVARRSMRNSIYGPEFQRARIERLAFCKGQCELHLFGRDVCLAYRVECHHLDSESYRRDRQGVIDVHDVICVCECCHDQLTNLQRGERYSGRSLDVIPCLPDGTNEVRYGLEE